MSFTFIQCEVRIVNFAACFILSSHCRKDTTGKNTMRLTNRNENFIREKSNEQKKKRTK